MTATKHKDDFPTLRGDKWRHAYHAQVVGILGGKAPRVSSRGKSFYNRDRWTLRILTTLVCAWAQANPGKDMTESVLRILLDQANTKRAPEAEIVVARTPDQLNIRTAMALIGGADHEGFHSRYSCKRTLRFDEVRFILDLWPKVPDWSRFHKLLQTWSNVVEDIRIERVGRVDYPGTHVKLHDLQDFILRQEAEGEEAARSHGANTGGALSIAMRTFRDVGLGYVTPTQEDALDRYRAENPEAVTLVLDGPLSDSLRETIALPAEDDVACLRIAFEVIVILYDLSSKVFCPACGARGSKITIRPLRDAAGNKVPGKAIATCSECGWEDEMDLPDKDDDTEADKDDIRFEDPKFEDFDSEDSKGSGDSGDSGESDDSEAGDDSGDDSGGSDVPSAPEDSDTSDAGADEGLGGSDDSDAGGEDEAEGTGTGKGSEAGGNEDSGDEGSGDSGEEDEEDGDDASNGGSDDGSEDEGESSGAESNNDGEDGGAGGFSEDSGKHKGNDWSDLADEALGSAEDDLGMHDNNSALEEAVGDAKDREDAKDKVKPGEASYRPLDTGLDEVLLVEESGSGREHDATQANALLQSVKAESSFLRARLRQIVRALEMTATIHGVRRGKDLSERYLVDTVASIRAGKRPKRAYWDRDEQIDTSLAAAVVIDESYSMKYMLRDATRMLCAITEPLDALGCAVQVSGFRNGRRYSNTAGMTAEDLDGCHRHHGVVHDVFKTFGESFRSVKWRFANTRAEGSTPMSDGVQFALDALDTRKEGHRVLFIITDGDPDPGHEPVIKRQIRLAKEAGIHVIGVGVGGGAGNVRNLYPDHVFSHTVSEIPKLLIRKLNELVDVSMASKRGRRMKKTG